MTLRALAHACPEWICEDEGDTARLVYTGQMRIVRSRKRMQLLKRRGVPMMHLGYGDGTSAQQERSPLGNLVRQGPWAWFEPTESYSARRSQRKLRKSLANIEARVYAALAANGYHIEVLPPTSEDRALRRSPRMKLTYLDFAGLNELSVDTLPTQYTPDIDIEIE